jgi:cyclophilin family peptidyl-prolyl cis-trans isomerase
MAELQRAQQRRRRKTRTIPIIVIVVGLAIALAIVTGNSHGSKKVSTSPTTKAGSTTTVTTPGATTPTTASVTAPTAPNVAGGGTITGPTPCPKADGTSPHITTFAKTPPNCLVAGKTYAGTFQTNEGNVVVSFDTTKTPKTANNFIVLSLYHYFDATALFRTDTSIGIIQGGSPHTQSASDPGPGYTINDEGSGFKYVAGDLVMARTSSPNSAGSQFFFCVTAACSNLNSQGTYVVFAHVTSGLAVLQKILALNVDQPGGLGGAPKVLVTVKALTITES